MKWVIQVNNGERIFYLHDDGGMFNPVASKEKATHYESFVEASKNISRLYYIRKDLPKNMSISAVKVNEYDWKCQGCSVKYCIVDRGTIGYRYQFEIIQGLVMIMVYLMAKENDVLKYVKSDLTLTDNVQESSVYIRGMLYGDRTSSFQIRDNKVNLRNQDEAAVFGMIFLDIYKAVEELVDPDFWHNSKEREINDEQEKR